MPTAPGLKIVYCLKRLPQLTHAEFSRHWREIHAPLVEKHRSVLRIARYVQAHSDLGTLSDQLRGSPEPYDGVAEIWYESRQASTHSPPIGDFLGSSQIAPKWRGARALRERQRRLT